MKKHYIPLAGLALMVGLLLTSVTHFVQAQTMAEFTPFTPTDLYTWDGSNFQSYEYSKPGLTGGINPMRFRLMAPNGFDRNAADGQQYPIIVFLHGSGEAAPADAALQDNEEQLYHGGQTHMNAVLNNTFPGFLLYPQARDVAGSTGPAWGSSSIELIVYIIDKLVADYKVDPDRIYIHGLSMGGEGTWRAINAYPQYFAAAHPMSAAGQLFWSDGRIANYVHIPLRHAQGGKDTAPTKEQGNDQAMAIRNFGGSIRYSYFPTGGHAIWDKEYVKADFFSWFLSKKKNMIHVYYEQTSFCPENPISASNPIKLGVSPGFANYEWAMNTTANVIQSGATANEYLATSAGTYYARFQRSSGIWSEWSPAVVLDDNRALSATPGISTNGKSVNLPALDGSSNVTLFGTTSKSFYQWQKNASNYSATTDITVSTAGTYTLATKDPAGATLDVNGAPTEYRPITEGCLSAYSTPVTVTTQNGANTPAPPTNFFAGSASNTSIAIRWDDRSANETGFELYRSTTSGSSYTLISILPASSTTNPQSYTDTNLQTNTTYYYRMRAVNTSGGSAYTAEVSATTGQDNIAPTSPVLLSGSTSRTEINLLWSNATDNVGVYEYDVYQNGALIATTSATTYKATGVVAMTSYTYVVKARDLAGNVSPPSNQVNAAAVNAGLFFRYYHHDNLTSTTQIETLGTFRFSGTVSTFSIVTTPPRTQNNKFAYIYEGFINIPTSGSYTFYTQSDDAAQLFINNTLNVNGDGTHACNKATGTPITLSAGTYPIKATYFDNGGSECFTVSWKGPGISEQPIPASALSDAYTPPAALTAPTNFAVNTPAPTYSQINVKWTDNSTNETGFEISRSKGSANVNGTYQVVVVRAANTTTWSDTGLDPATQYNYKIRAINATSASALVGPLSITTATAPAAPAVPTGFNATAASSTQVNLAWANVANETGYEIQKSSSASTGFFTIVTKGVNEITHTDTQVAGHTTVYYRIRALGNGGSNSVYSSVISVTTPNQAPVIPDTPDQSITQDTATPQTINITATDADADPITFTVTGLPTGGTSGDDGYGKLTLTFVNIASGSYPITVEASDGISMVSDNFTLTVGTNHNPVIQDVAVNGGAVTAMTTISNQTTEGGRPLTLAIRVTDPDSNAELLTTLPPLFSNLPSFVTTNTWTGTTTNPRTLTLTFSPGATVAGVYENITITFRDNQGGTNTQVFSLVVLPLDKSYTIRVNFNHLGTNNESSPWNNMGAPSALDRTNLLDDQGVAVKYVVINTNAGVANVWNTTTPASGTLPADASGVYTDKVRQSFYRRSSSSAGTIQFKNLNPELRYKVTVYGAYPGAEGTVLNTSYTITGATAETLADLNVINNTSTTRSTTGFIQPLNGVISIAVKRGVDNTGFFYINAVELKAALPSNDPPAAPTNLTLTAPAYNTVNLAWQDNSINETSFEIWRATLAAGPYTLVGTASADGTSFTDTNGVNGRTTYYYKVKAVNAFGSNETAFDVITTPNGAPIIGSLGTIIIQAGQTVQKNISATDPEGDVITFSVLGLPSFATLVDNGNGTGFIRFIPQLSDAGSHTFTLKATDSQSAGTQTEVTFLVVDSEYDEAFYLNFVSTADANAGSPWNNILPFTNSTSLKNSLGVTSSNLYFTAGTGWTSSSNTAGISTGGNSGIYPDKVIQSSWSTSSTTGVTMSLTNLDNSKLYNIALFGSTNDFWFGNTMFTINGVTKTLNTIQNKSNIVRFTGIQPTGNAITVVIKKGPNIATGGTKPTLAQRDARLGAMVVEAYTQSTTPRRPTNIVAKGISRTAIRLTWFDNSSDETGFEIYRADSPSGPFTLLTTVSPNTETFDNTGLTKNTAYTYRIRAIKAAGQSVFSDDAIASTYNQVILVNFSSSGVTDLQAPSPWNNTNNASPVNGVSFNNLKDDTWANTVVDLEIIESLGYSNNTGFQPASGDAPGIYPNEVSQGFYYWNSNDPGQWRIKQLNPNYTYDLVFYANEWNALAIDGVNCTTDWTVGDKTVSLFNNKNAYETVTMEQVKPESDGTIAISVVNNAIAAAGVWNALEIRSNTPLDVSSDTEPPSVPQNLQASVITDVSLQLSWDASTDNIGIDGYEVFQGTELVATVSDITTPIANLQPSTQYTFSVRAFDLKGNRSALSNAILVTTLSSSSTANAFYCLPTGNITFTETWGDQPDGSGSHPADFTSGNATFTLIRNAVVDAPWTVTGANTKLVVNDNVTLTINDTLTGFIEVKDNANVIINAGASPQFGTIAATATTTFSGEQSTIPGASYGNLVLAGENSTKTFSTGTYVINGNLTIADDIVMNGATGNGTVLSITGNLDLQGNPTMPADDQLLFNLHFNSGGSQSLNAHALDTRFAHLRVSNNSQLMMVNSEDDLNTLTLGTSTGGGLTLEAGSSLALNKNDLVIEGNGAVNSNDETGELHIAKTSITFNSTGSIVSNLYFNSAADTVKAFNLNMSNAGQVNIKNLMYVRNVIDINNGKLNSNGNVVLISDITGTARIASIRNSGALLGNIEFQRYLNPLGRVYRYLSAPVFSTKVQDWQTYIPVTGTFTGRNLSNSNPSLFYYDESNDDPWVPFPESTNQETFAVGRGYSIFIREATNPTKLRIKGPIQQGNFDYAPFLVAGSPADDDGWNLLGNPYASPISWSHGGWTTNGITGSVYIRSNTNIGGTAASRVLAWNGTIGDEEFKGIIAQGQSFWVKSFDDSPSILITEDAKYDTLKANVFRTSPPKNYLTITLANSGLIDKAYIHFRKNATNGVDEKTDAVNSANDYFDITTLVEEIPMAINSMSDTYCSNSIRLNLTNTKSGNSYTMSFANLNSFEYTVHAKLIDHFMGKETSISEGSIYNFTVSGDAASTGRERFELVISKAELDTQVTMELENSILCETKADLDVRLINSQAGAVYKIMQDEKVLGSFTGSGSTLDAILPVESLHYGVNYLKLSAEIPGCTSALLLSQTALTVIQAYTPVTTNAVICEAEVATLHASGAPEGATYKWFTSNSADNQEPIATSTTGFFVTPELYKSSTYYVSASLNGCESDRKAATVGVEHLEIPTILVAGDHLVSSSENGNQWNLNDAPIDGATAPILVPKVDGSYTVTVVDGTCTKLSSPVVFLITSLEQGLSAGLTLHPNPVKDRIKITLPASVKPGANVTLYIYNAQGILAGKYSKINQPDGIDITATNLSSGYYVMFIEVDGHLVQQRFIKE